MVKGRSETGILSQESGVTDPLVSFAFKIEFDSAPVARCSGVDGLSKEFEMIEYRDSAMPNLPRFRQGRAKAPRITLKRAYLNGGNSNPFYEWLAQGDNNGVIQPKDVTITVGAYGLKEEERNYGSQNAWVLLNCRPVKWSLGSLDGTSNSLIFETIELTCEEIHLNPKK